MVWDVSKIIARVDRDTFSRVDDEVLSCGKLLNQGSVLGDRSNLPQRVRIDGPVPFHWDIYHFSVYHLLHDDYPAFRVKSSGENDLLAFAVLAAD